MILDSVLDHVGNTPMVRADRLAKEYGIKCNLLCKCEYFNAGGSVKDRIAKRMIQRAEKDGRLIPGKSVIIEPTSGNTGTGLALQAAVRGYRCIIVMPEKMSQEKQIVMQALGAEVIRTPTDAGHDDPRSHIQVARRLEKEIPHGIVLDQYANLHNPMAHYEGTAVEIIEDIRKTVPSLHSSVRHRSSTIDKIVENSGMTSGLPTTDEDDSEDKENTAPTTQLKPTTRPRGNTLDRLINGSGRMFGLPTTKAQNGHARVGSKESIEELTKQLESSSLRPSSGIVDLLVAGAGTGGTVSGTGKRLKEEWRETRILGIDPVGSILAMPETLNVLKVGQSPLYKVEGIGYEFVPEVLNRSLIDSWVKVDDDAAFAMARKLIRTEGLLIGGSSGCAMAGVIEYLTKTEEGKKIAEDETKNVVVIMPDSIRNYITKPWLLDAEP